MNERDREINPDTSEKSEFSQNVANVNPPTAIKQDMESAIEVSTKSDNFKQTSKSKPLTTKNDAASVKPTLNLEKNKETGTFLDIIHSIIEKQLEVCSQDANLSKHNNQSAELKYCEKFEILKEKQKTENLKSIQPNTNQSNVDYSKQSASNTSSVSEFVFKVPLPPSISPKNLKSGVSLPFKLKKETSSESSIAPKRPSSLNLQPSTSSPNKRKSLSSFFPVLNQSQNAHTASPLKKLSPEKPKTTNAQKHPDISDTFQESSPSKIRRANYETDVSGTSLKIQQFSSEPSSNEPGCSKIPTTTKLFPNIIEEPRVGISVEQSANTSDEKCISVREEKNTEQQNDNTLDKRH